MSPRVLLLSTSLGMGGADRQILYLAHALLARQYEVRLVAMVPLEEMGEKALAEGLPITSLNMLRGRPDWHAFQRLLDLIREWQPHVLTSFMYHANLLGRIAGRWAGVPLIVSSIRSERNGSTLRDWLMRLTNRMDHCCTTNSRQVADSLLQRGLLSDRKLRIIPNGVDVSALSAPPEEGHRVRRELRLGGGQFLWLAVGRLLDQKDYPTLLQAFQSLPENSARLAIVGRGPELDDLKRQSEQLGIADRVLFLGVRGDIAALLSAADGFVLSSAWEGMPNVVMEALAAAVPVVATRVGGVPELVEAGRSGFLVPPGNPTALSDAMGRLMALPFEERRRMGWYGRDHVATHYGLPVMADRWISLYEELMTRRGIAEFPNPDAHLVSLPRV